MIYYGKDHIQAAIELEERYDLPHRSPREYIDENEFQVHCPFTDRDRLFYAIQSHPTLHAYTLNDLKLHIHPDALLKLLTLTYQEFFENIV